MYWIIAGSKVQNSDVWLIDWMTNRKDNHWQENWLLSACCLGKKYQEFLWDWIERLPCALMTQMLVNIFVLTFVAQVFTWRADRNVLLVRLTMSQTMSQLGVWLGTFTARSTGNSCSELTAFKSTCFQHSEQHILEKCSLNLVSTVMSVWFDMCMTRDVVGLKEQKEVVLTLAYVHLCFSMALITNQISVILK